MDTSYNKWKSRLAICGRTFAELIRELDNRGYKVSRSQLSQWSSRSRTPDHKTANAIEDIIIEWEKRLAR